MASSHLAAVPAWATPTMNSRLLTQTLSHTWKGAHNMIIRALLPNDDAAIERIIRSCLIEFGANRAGLAWEDESLSHLSDYYAPEGSAYWVVEEKGTVVGGCGIAPFAG